MKILVILPNLGGGGAEKVHISLANNWVKNGHEVTICSGLITPDSPFEIDKRINVIHPVSYTHLTLPTSYAV